MSQPRRAPRIVACHGKEALEPSRARSLAKAMRRRGKRTVNAYHCDHCGGWHVGTHVAPKAQLRRPRPPEIEE